MRWRKREERSLAAMDFWRGVRWGGGGGGGRVVEPFFEVGVVVLGASVGEGFVSEVEDEGAVGWVLAGGLEVLWVVGRLGGDGF